MRGWKTWTGAALIGGGAVARALGYEEVATLVEGLGAALGVVGVPVAKEPKTSIRASVSKAVEESGGFHPCLLWKKSPNFSNV
jgi:hypothetical protein